LILPIDWVPELATDNGSVVSMAQVSVKMAKGPSRQKPIKHIMLEIGK